MNITNAARSSCCNRFKSRKYGRHSTTISFKIDLQFVVGVGENKAFDGNAMNASNNTKAVTKVFILLQSKQENSYNQEFIIHCINRDEYNKEKRKTFLNLEL